MEYQTGAAYRVELGREIDLPLNGGLSDAHVIVVEIPFCFDIDAPKFIALPVNCCSLRQRYGRDNDA